MLNRLIVVPDNGQHHLEDATKDAWGAFEVLIPNHPLVSIPVEHHPPYAHRIDAVAAAVPLLNRGLDQVDAGMIMLGERFWSPEQSSDDRALTLLHEAIHLRLADTMSPRTVRSDAMRRRFQDAEAAAFEEEPLDIAVFKQKRGVAAFQFHLFPEEVWAELYVRDHYPEWLERRLVSLLAMRQGTRARREAQLAGIPQPLICSWLIYELVRVDLVIALEQDDRRLAQLNDLKQEWSTDLLQLCPPERLEVELRTFAESIPNPLEADAISEARFDRYADAVLAIPPL